MSAQKILGCVVLVLCGTATLFTAAKNAPAHLPTEKTSADSTAGGKPGKRRKDGTAKPPIRTEKAVLRGITYLKKRIQSPGKLYYFGSNDDAHVGAMALAGLTLLSCDVPPDDDAIKKAIATVHENAKIDAKNPTKGLRFTYSLALCVLFLDKLTQYDKIPMAERGKHRRLLRQLALQLIAGQHKNGGWGYVCQVLGMAEQKRLLRFAVSWSWNKSQRRQPVRCCRGWQAEAPITAWDDRPNLLCCDLKRGIVRRLMLSRIARAKVPGRCMRVGSKKIDAGLWQMY